MEFPARKNNKQNDCFFFGGGGKMVFRNPKFLYTGKSAIGTGSLNERKKTMAGANSHERGEGGAKMERRGDRRRDLV